MARDPHEQETREVGALPTMPSDDALTPKRGTPTARVRTGVTKATLGLSRRHWSGAKFVVLILLLTATALLVFMAIKQMS